MSKKVKTPPEQKAYVVIWTTEYDDYDNVQKVYNDGDMKSFVASLIDSDEINPSNIDVYELGKPVFLDFETVVKFRE